MKSLSVATSKWLLNGETENEMLKTTATQLASSVKPQPWPLPEHSFQCSGRKLAIWPALYSFFLHEGDLSPERYSNFTQVGEVVKPEP